MILIIDKNMILIIENEATKYSKKIYTMHPTISYFILSLNSTETTIFILIQTFFLFFFYIK